MHERPRLLIALILLTAMVLHIAGHNWVGFSDRAPRVVTLAVAVIALRWGSVAGAFLGALCGLTLALLSGEAPFAGTAALAVAGWLAGEIPTRFVVESHRAIGLAILVASLMELVLVCLMRRIMPPGGLDAVIWMAGWAIVVGPLLYRLVARLSTPPSVPRLPREPE